MNYKLSERLQDIKNSSKSFTSFSSSLRSKHNSDLLGEIKSLTQFLSSLPKITDSHHIWVVYYDNKLKSGYLMKTYIMPSGVEVMIQGYENLYLNEYFDNGGTEDNIDTQPKQFEFWYETPDDGKKHRYYPDFYLKEENKIIEVKSEYTYDMALEVNLLKEQCVKNSGIDFEFKIY